MLHRVRLYDYQGHYRRTGLIKGKKKRKDHESHVRLVGLHPVALRAAYRCQKNHGRRTPDRSSGCLFIISRAAEGPCFVRLAYPFGRWGCFFLPLDKKQDNQVTMMVVVSRETNLDYQQRGQVGRHRRTANTSFLHRKFCTHRRVPSGDSREGVGRLMVCSTEQDGGRV